MYENKDVTRHGNQFVTRTNLVCNPGACSLKCENEAVCVVVLPLSLSISASVTWRIMGVNGVGLRSTNGVMYGHKQEHSEKTDPPDSLKSV